MTAEPLPQVPETIQPPRFKRGDVVRLNSGGPAMTVIVAFGTSAKEALRDMQRAKKQPQIPLPPIIECVHPAMQKPGWLSQMVEARAKLESDLKPRLQPA
jgi:hypothetical protein